jgi:hypothetical protein
MKNSSNTEEEKANRMNAGVFHMKKMRAQKEGFCIFSWFQIWFSGACKKREWQAMNGNMLYSGAFIDRN